MSHRTLSLLSGLQPLPADQLLTKLVNILTQHPRWSWGGYDLLRNARHKVIKNVHLKQQGPNCVAQETTQYCVINQDGKEDEKEYTYVSLNLYSRNLAYPFSSESSQTRNQPRVSHIAGGFFTNWAIREEALNNTTSIKKKKSHLPLILGVQFHGAMEWWGAGGKRTHWSSSLSQSFGSLNVNTSFNMIQNYWKGCLKESEMEWILSPQMYPFGR